jgi:hypothetical protein
MAITAMTRMDLDILKPQKRIIENHFWIFSLIFLMQLCNRPEMFISGCCFSHA